MKRLITVLLALMMVLPLLAACSSGGNDPSEAPSATPAASASPADSPSAEGPAEPAEPVSVYPLQGNPELTVWRSVSPTFLSTIDDFEDTPGYYEHRANTGVVVHYTVVTANNASESANLILASGDYPDIMEGGETHAPGGGLAALYDQGIILEVTEMVEKWMPNYTKMRTMHESYVKDTINDDGLMLAVATVTAEGYPITVGPTIRKDWLDDLGMDIPVTYEDYYDVLTAFKVEKGADAAMWVTTCGLPYYNYLAAGYGISAYSDAIRPQYTPFFQVDGEVRFGILEPGWKEFMGMIQQWYDEGLIYQDFMG